LNLRNNNDDLEGDNENDLNLNNVNEERRRRYSGTVLLRLDQGSILRNSILAKNLQNKF
jgi:hypothetical protein